MDRSGRVTALETSRPYPLAAGVDDRLARDLHRRLAAQLTPAARREPELPWPLASGTARKNPNDLLRRARVIGSPMTDEPKPATEAEIEQEIREGRRFSMEEAMARMAGPGAMSGASPVSEVQQAETEIGTWLRANLPDASGALKAVVHRHLKGSRAVLDNLEQPLEAVRAFCERVLGSEELVRELVREADVEWGRAMDELPHFDRDGSPSHPDDPYTAESVSAALRAALREHGNGPA